VTGREGEGKVGQRAGWAVGVKKKKREGSGLGPDGDGFGFVFFSNPFKLLLNPF
jgi:hypothetical protein